MGLGKVNPNGKAWQFQASQYYSKSNKIASFTYIWPAGDTFSRLCITSFLLNKKLCNLNYYRDPEAFNSAFCQLLSRRLVSDLKFRLFKEQKGLCLVCKLCLDIKDVVKRSPTIHIHHLVPRSAKHLAGKLYESKRNKVLLHGSCHLSMHKTVYKSPSPYIRFSVPRKPITL